MSTIASGVCCTWARKYGMMKMVSSHCVADSFPQPDSNNWHIGFSTETLYILTHDVYSNLSLKIGVTNLFYPFNNCFFYVSLLRTNTLPKSIHVIKRSGFNSQYK